MAKSPAQLDREIEANLKKEPSKKADRRKIRYVTLAWTNPSGYAQRFVEGSFPESTVETLLEGAFQSGVTEANVEGRDFTLSSIDDVYEAAKYAHDSVAQRRR